MLSKFFPKRPQKGQPLSLRGLFPGLAKMDHAWATLSCLGGQISWDHGRPTIIPPGGGGIAGDTQLDHAFLPTQDTATTATLTPGNVTDQHGTRRSITEAGAGSMTNLWNGGVINFSSFNRWYVRIIYSNVETGSPTFLLPGDYIEMQWIGTSAAFPQHKVIIGDDLTINIPVIEFPDGDWASMIRRQTNDILGGEKGPKGDTGNTGETGPEGPAGSDADCEGLYGPDNPPPYDAIDGAPSTGSPWPTPTPSEDILHAGLGDIVNGDAGDDHVDASRGGTGTNAPYMHLSEGSIRNACSTDMVIGNSNGDPSIQPSARILTGTSADEGAVEWSFFKCLLRSQNHTGTWGTRTSLDWRLRRLYADNDASTPLLSADWLDRFLYGSDGETITLDWNTQQPAIDPAANDQAEITDSTPGTPTTTLSAVGDTSAGDESAPINDNFASLAAQLDNARLDNIAMKAEITALRDALQAYKIIATTP